MKHRLLWMAIIMFATFSTPPAVAQNFDFSAVASTGQTLYYKITDSSSHTVSVVGPAGNSSDSWTRYTKPTGNMTLPDTVSYNGIIYQLTNISLYAFYGCSGLTSLTIPNSINSIGEHAFNGCNRLNTLFIPHSISHIGSRAFSGCSGLTSIVVESSNTYYDSRNNSNAIIETATNTLLQGCRNTVVPRSTMSIGDYAFYNCSGLTSVTIGDSVISIGSSAFYNCSGLTSVTIPNSVTTIGSYAFRNCRGLTTMTIPRFVTSIGVSAFGDCSALYSIVFNADSCIGYNGNSDVFYACTNISNFTFGNNVKRIPNYLCSGLSGLTSITIPDSVVSIGKGAFQKCRGLTSVTIPNRVTSIGDYAFQDCTSLTSVTFNADSCISAGSSSAIFNHCSNLTSITFGNNVKRIPSYLCYGLTGLTSVTIPNSVASIGNYAFRNCSGLTSITSLASEPPVLGSNVFQNVSSAIPVHVLCVAEAYRSATGWQSFSNIQDPSDCISACDSFYWHGNSYYNSGIHVAGNDTLRLTIRHSTTGIDSRSVCDSMSWYNGTLYTAANTTDTIHRQTVHGCDSLVTLNLTVRYSSTGIDSRSVCDSMSWYNGTLYTAANTTDTIHRINAAGCDSLVTLNLAVRYSSTGIDIRSVCDSLRWYNGILYTTPNMSDTIHRINHVGCDSLVTLNLTVRHSTTYNDVYDVCNNFTWTRGNGRTYTSSNSTDAIYLVNAVGCDSTVTLHLTINRNTTGAETITACNSYTWHGTAYTASTNTATYTTSNAAGCDSIVTLNLTVNYSGSSSETIEANDWYVWTNHGNRDIYTTSGTYFSSYTTPEGCPSVDTLYLTINATPPTHDTVYMTNYIHDTVYTTVDCPPQDTLYITETVAVHDTTIVNNYIHDTTYMTTHTSDTVYLGSPDSDTVWLTRTEWEYIHDTVYQTVNHYIHDTVVLDNYIHDTTVVNNYIHDTVLVQGSGSDTVWMGGTHTVYIHDTLYRNVYFHVRDTVIVDHYHDTLVLERTIVDYIHDTAYINLYIHDTTVVTDYVHDTTIIDNYIYDTLTVTNHVHDTAYITTMIYDTLYVDTNTHDTVWLTRTVQEYIHDTVYRTVNHYIHDTTFITNYVHDTAYINRYIHDTTFVYNYIHDTLYLDRYLHDTIYIHDTVYIHGEGISAADVVNAKVYSSRGQVVVEGADGNAVTLYDLSGRTLATRSDEQEPLRFDVPASGAYLIKIGRHAPRKVVVIK